MLLKRLFLKPLSFGPLAQLAEPLLHDAMPVFMLHRFAHPDLGVAGVSAECMRESLEYLRAEGFRPVSLADVVAGRATGKGVPVVFTVDDGYSDFRDIGLPVFSDFDCPVTVFVSSGVIDRTCWYWWDSLRLMFEQTSRMRFELQIDALPVRFDLSTPMERERQLLELIERFKDVPDTTRRASFDELSALLDVTLPPVAPDYCTPMTWPEIRACAAGGVANFGPHTITHAALPMTLDAQAKQEIVGSWARLREECPAALPVFCYPFGAYSDREIGILRATDMVGALTTEPAYSSRAPFSDKRGRGQFEVPRFGYPDDSLGFRQIVIGLERVKMALRGGRSGWQSLPAPRQRQ